MPEEAIILDWQDPLVKYLLLLVADEVNYLLQSQ